jgi:hypothetical protein
VTSSAELVFGSPLVLPGQLLVEAERPVNEYVKNLHATELAMRLLTYAQATVTVPMALI